MTMTLDEAIQHCEEKSCGSTGCADEHRQLGEWLNELKELRSQNTWKPSDEQMNLLREVQQALLGKDCHNRFVNFMYELKRLREK